MPVVATAPTLPSNVKGFDLNKEMDLFKDLLRKQFEKAKMKVETTKLKECEEIKDCINQKSLLKELKESIGVSILLWRVCLPKQPKLRQQQLEYEKLGLSTHIEVIFKVLSGK